MSARCVWWRCRLSALLILCMALLVDACASQTLRRQTTTVPPPPAAGLYALAFASGTGSVVPAGTIYAFDARTGMPRWQVQPTGQIAAAPAATRTLVYIGTNGTAGTPASRATGVVSAYDAATGVLVWQAAVAHVTQVVAFATGVLVGEESADGKSPPQYSITALSATNGMPLWTFPTRLTQLGVAPVVADGIAYVVANPHPSASDPFPATIVSALNITTGAVLWQRRVHTLVTGMAADADGVCLSGAVGPTQADGAPTGALVALRAFDGTPQWQVSLAAPASAPALDASSVYISATVGATTTIAAVARATGKARWSTPAGTIATGTNEASFALLGGMLFASTVAPAAPAVIALRTSDGSFLWQRREDQAPTPPVAFGATVYIGLGTALQTAQKGRIEALNAATGLVSWRFQVQGSIPLPPTVG
jgi:outer membrane protein assembly factor BamB